jgi:probable HAF family extracellular repeat protein
MSALGILAGRTGSSAWGINSLGQVVGDGDIPSGTIHALLFNNGTVTDLNGLISPSSGWVLTEATSISDSGYIVGSRMHNGQTAAYLLTPVPEPSSIALVAIGAGALYILRHRRLVVTEI